MERSQFRTTFWEQVSLPPGVTLTRRDSIVVPQRGAGGSAVYDVAELRYRERVVPVLIACRPRVLPGEVAGLKKRMIAAADELRLRTPIATHSPMIATASAGPATVEACARMQVALVDLRGTLILERGDVLLHVSGRGELPPIPRKGNLFRGKNARVVRMLLAHPELVVPIRTLANHVQSGYANVYNAVELLARAGFVEKLGGHRGIRLSDPVGLLQAWIDSGDPTAAAVERFNARATTPTALATGMARLQGSGTRGIFTLASALRDEERWVSALPHGIYCAASREILEDAFGLRTQTPYNFLVFRPEPAADTDEGGVYTSPRKTENGPGVALPQLIVDFHRAGGRGKEQGQRLFEEWTRALPFSGRFA